MEWCGQTRPIIDYVELASPQILDDSWRELYFDLTNDHNVLKDLVAPESASGYVYRDAKIIGSATHNRFIYWRASNDALELVELSSEVVLDDNQVRVKFTNSYIVNDVKLIEFSDSVVLMVATVSSVHRIHLPHPRTTNKSILSELTSEILFDPANYYLLSSNGSLNSQQPNCASSWSDKTTLKCALSFPDSSLLIVQFGKNTHHVSTYDIKQTGIIGRLWSRMPNLLVKHPHDCDNAIFVSIPYHHEETNDVLLFTLCRDCKIRVFSTVSRECIITHNMIPQSSFSQSYTSHTNPTTELPMMKLIGSHIAIYLTETRPEFTLLEYTYEDGRHFLKEKSTVQAPNWEKLIEFTLSNSKIWALANIHETESVLCYLDTKSLISDDADAESDLESVWQFVNLVDDIDLPTGSNLVAEIFWRSRFSTTTIQKALAGFPGPVIPKNLTMEALEMIAYTRIVDENQEEAWNKFYNYCVQNHHHANKNIGLVVGEDESVISIIKRSNPSFVCPWYMTTDGVSQSSCCRGIKYSPHIKNILESLDYVTTHLLDEDNSRLFEQKLFENPIQITGFVEELVASRLKNKKFNNFKSHFTYRSSIPDEIDYICDQLDITDKANKLVQKVLKEQTKKIKSERCPMRSNSGIIIAFELFRRIVRARMILARDLLFYIYILIKHCHTGRSTADKHLAELYDDLFLSKRVRRLTNSLRSYAILVWMTEASIKITTDSPKLDLINLICARFEFFKNASTTVSKNVTSILDTFVHHNLLTNFLATGGISLLSRVLDVTKDPLQTISSSHYVTTMTLNLCKLLWPASEHLCFLEYLFSRQLDDHLSKYLELSEDWLDTCLSDRHFIKAANCLLQNRPSQSIDIFNRLWINLTPDSLVGRFVEMDEMKPKLEIGNFALDPKLVYNYYDKLIQLFQIYNDPHCLVTLINHCMTLIDNSEELEHQHWINCFRAKLFQYYLEMDDSDEAYHTMVLTSDPNLRINCLRKFVVHHCEKEQWTSLLTYPFIDIKTDFIDILNQKADSLDLSKLNDCEFHKTSYYDLLFAYYISDEEYRRAAEIMYNYAQRLSLEVPGVISIRKQADCLLIALNALRCVKEEYTVFESGALYKEDGRTSVLKRAHDCEHESNVKSLDGRSMKVDSKDIELKYELTRARVKLLEKDQVANAIALSPLKPDETIAQLVASSLFSSAIDLALLFKCPMEPILDGLTAKYISIIRLSAIDIAMHQDLERDLTDIFCNSYSNIDTYNYIANSTSSLVDKLWRLIDYYLTSYDGISHRYVLSQPPKSTGTTVLMRVVAEKILSAGYDIPASLRRMYMTRNTAELLKLLIKYDQLTEAADLTIEMTDRILEPSTCYALTSPFTSSILPPVYLPTHLIILLITYLNEDATDIERIKLGNVLAERLNKFRCSIKLC